MKNISIWKDTVKEKHYPKLNENKQVDVLIIGGGITGVSTLYQLRNSDLSVMLVEQYKIAGSTSANNTGKLNFLQNDLLDKIRKSTNDETAKKYVESQQYAIRMITDVIKKEKIDCDLEKKDASLYTNKKSEIPKIKDLENFLESCNIKTTKVKNNDLVKSKYMFTVSDTYTFHPIKYVYGLLKNNKFPIYENTSIKRIVKENDYYICMTDEYKIKAKYVVIASHYPYFNIPYVFPVKASLEKSYLSASKHKEKPISLISYSKPTISMRDYKDHLIYLSNSHSINKNINSEKNFGELQKKIKDLKLKPDYLWSNIDIMTNDGLPYIGKLKDNIFIATGYNTWGLTNGPLAGQIIADLITEKDNKYIELFNPKRFNLAQLLGILSNIYKNTSSFIKSYLIKSDKVIYTKKDNKKVMIYKYKEKEHVVNRKCPHFGCALTFNEVEKTWDCPCHGSRYDLDGNTIMSPSNHSIKIKKYDTIESERSINVEEDVKVIINRILVNKEVKDNVDFLIKYIPEIKYMIGFKHNHPHHHLDVWNHTLLALDNLESDDLETNMALLLHDIGKPFSYQDAEVRHFKGHALESEKIARTILNRLGYDDKFIEDVCYLVKNHDNMINTTKLDNTIEMIQKRLSIQYADAKAHNPMTVEKRLNLLDEVSKKLLINSNTKKKMLFKKQS